MKKNLTLGILTTLILMFNACKKSEDGNPGPAGKDGVANINNSISPFLSSSDWTHVSDNLWSYTMYIPALTNADSDAVMVYVFTASTASYFALPCSQLLGSSDEFIFEFKDNNVVRIYYINTTAPTEPLKFKVVVIPPAMKKPNINYKDYFAVKAAYNL